MSKSKTFTIPVHTIGDFDGTPSIATITVDSNLAKRIRLLQRTLKSVGADYIQEYNYTPEYLVDEDNPKEWDGNVDCSQLVISDKEFWWEAKVKHTNVSIETQTIPLTDLKGV